MKYLLPIKWVIPVGLVGYVLWQAWWAYGPLQAVTNFNDRTPHFDVLLPAGRVARGETGIALIQEPVYIELRLPVRAQSIALELRAAAGSAPIKLGYQTADGFAFHFSDAAPLREAETVLYRYDLTDISYVRPGHRVRFIISSPSLIPGSVVIKGASVSIKRRQADAVWWFEQFRKLWH